MNSNIHFHSPSSLDYPYIGFQDPEDDYIETLIESNQY